MRNVFVFGLTLLVSTVLTAGENPIYYGKLHGLAMTGLTKRESVEFLPGKLSNCDRKEVVDLVSFRCDAEGTNVTVTSKGGEKFQAHVNRLVVFYKPQRNGDVVREYHLTGSYVEKTKTVKLSSNIRVTLWNYKSSPNDIRGWIDLPSYASTVSSVQLEPAP